MSDDNTSLSGLSRVTNDVTPVTGGFSGRLFRPGPEAPRPVRGRVVLVHGLNLAPVTMDPLASWLAAQGFVVARVALSGHRESFRELMRIRHEAWESDVVDAVARLAAHVHGLLRKAADRPGHHCPGCQRRSP